MIKTHHGYHFAMFGSFPIKTFVCLLVCLRFTSLQQRGHLETAPPFTVHYKGREAR